MSEACSYLRASREPFSQNQPLPLITFNTPRPDEDPSALGVVWAYSQEDLPLVMVPLDATNQVLAYFAIFVLITY